MENTFFLIPSLQFNYQSNLNSIKPDKGEIISKYQHSNHLVLLTTIFSSQRPCHLTLTQTQVWLKCQKKKQSCLNTIAFKSCVNRIIAKLSLKSPKYNFSDLQDSETQEESTSSGTYHVSCIIRNVRSQERSLQAPNHCLFVFFASRALFSVCPEHPPIFCLTWSTGQTVCSLGLLA